MQWGGECSQQPCDNSTQYAENSQIAQMKSGNLVNARLTDDFKAVIRMYSK